MCSQGLGLHTYELTCENRINSSIKFSRNPTETIGKGKVPYCTEISFKTLGICPCFPVEPLGGITLKFPTAVLKFLNSKAKDAWNAFFFSSTCPQRPGNVLCHSQMIKRDKKDSRLCTHVLSKIIIIVSHEEVSLLYDVIFILFVSV